MRFPRSLRELRKQLMHRFGPKDPGRQWQPGYPNVDGPRYEPYLKLISEAINTRTYLEIGSETGKSLRQINADTIAVDPNFNIKYEFVGTKKRVFMFQQTSDEFFSTGFLQRYDTPIEFAFLDGMHEFEFLLRDFLNTARFVKQGSIIAMHDCVPINSIMARRDRKAHSSSYWTGDVWKVLPIIQSNFPDLAIEVLNLAPTAIAVVHSFPQTPIAADIGGFGEEMTKWRDVTLAEYGLEQFQRQFPLVDPDMFISKLSQRAPN